MMLDTKYQGSRPIYKPMFCLFELINNLSVNRVGVIKIVIVINCNLITFYKVIACNCN